MAFMLASRCISRSSVVLHAPPVDLSSSRAAFRLRPSLQRCRLRHAYLQRMIQTRAIGFDLGTETGKGTEKHAENLTRAAASLLLFQNVLKGRPAQAFLKLLLLLQKGRIQDILEAYGDLYSSLAAGNHLSWQDYLLEEVLIGKYNCFARVAAKGELLRASPLHKAVAYDLDILQKLAVAETTLVSWVEDVSRSLPQGWPGAAASSGPSTKPQQGACKTEALHLPSDLAAPDFISAPLTPQQRSAYRANIGGKWRWAEALPELQYYYETYGFGITASSSTLKWAGGFLEVHTPPTGQNRRRADTGQSTCTDLLVQNTINFLNHTDFESSMLIASGAPGSAVAWDSYLQEVAPLGVRLVQLNSADVTQLADVAFTLQQYPRVKFAVVCASMMCSEGSGAHAALHSVLTGGGWPDNAILYAASPLTVSESISSCFSKFL